MHDGLPRIIDANLNRAREGLRVAEEYARFCVEDAALTERLKRLRHGLREAEAELARGLPAGESLLDHRDTPGDVGTGLTCATEQARAGAEDVARAAMKRLEESLRALEEYGKALAPGAGAGLEKLRYEAYAIESLLLRDGDARQRLREARLYVLVTGSLASTDAATACREALAGGADIIQMREKELEDAAFLALAERLRALCREAGALFIVNDRPHLAALSGADGVHIGQGDLPVHLTRRVAGRGLLVGRSTSAPEYAEAALRDGADYIGVGPVHETATKKHRAAAGLEYVRYAAARVRMPYFCIGAINRDTLKPVLEAGARAVAICTAIIGARDIAAEAAWFKERVLESSPRG